MSKLVGITLRQECCSFSKETRDQLDIRFYSLLKECDLIPILLPNDETIVKEYLSKIKFSGFIFTGGGEPFPYSCYRTTRDCIEKILLEYSLVNDLPILGICRGMLVLGVYFGTELVKVKGHVGLKHKIINKNEEIQIKNSFHNWAIKEGNESIQVNKLSEDGVIEAVINEKNKIYGIMWHPERMNKYEYDDIEFIHNIFK